MASAPSREPNRRSASLVRICLLTNPVEADMPFAIALVTSLDQRSPQMFDVANALSDSATSRVTSVNRSVMRP